MDIKVRRRRERKWWVLGPDDKPVINQGFNTKAQAEEAARRLMNSAKNKYRYR